MLPFSVAKITRDNQGLVVYDAERGDRISTAKAVVELCANFWMWRALAWELFKRDFLASYKRSFLGYFWILITPLFSIVGWLLFNGLGVLKPGDVGVPYPVYVLVGTAFWSLFLGSVGAASGVFSSSTALLTQVKYPHEVMIWKSLAQTLSQFIVSLVLILLAVLISGSTVHWTIVLVPIVILPLILTGIAVGLILASLNVVAPDVYSATNMGLGFLLFFSPIVYSRESLESRHLFREIAMHNPLTFLLCNPRDLIIYGRPFGLEGFAYSTLFAIAFFVIVWRAFVITEPRLIERLQ